MGIKAVIDVLDQLLAEYCIIDLRVAAVKSTWPLQVKSSRFSSKSPPKFPTQVAFDF